jgi:hypothetical protein
MNLVIKFILITAIVWIIFDIWIIKKKGKSASISANVIRYVNLNRLGFLMTAAFFFVCGHLFWSMKTEDVYPDIKCVKKEYLKELEENKCLKR